MLRKIKVWILKNIISRVCKLSLLFRGVKYGKNCFIYGFPVIRRKRNSLIRLGDNVTIVSVGRNNPLLEKKTRIKTISPNAVIELDNNVGISGVSLIACNKISIGEYTVMGPDTVVYDSIGHDYSPERGWSSSRVRMGRPICIGKKCYIGMKCIILNGVTIGDNCVIAAGTVVTQNVPSGHKAYGNPARIVPLPKILGGVK